MTATLVVAAVLLAPQSGQVQSVPNASDGLACAGTHVRNPSMIDIAITLKPGADIATVAPALAQAGLVIEHKLDAIGSITGKAAPQVIPRLRAVVGVEDVSEITPIQIAPPDSSIQ